MVRRNLPRRNAGRLHALVFSVSLLSGLVSCTDGITDTLASDQALQWVTLNATAVTLDTTTGYSTVRLSVTSYRGDGSIILDAVPTFTVSDEALHVTDDGLVTGVKTTIKSSVLARVTYQGVTRTDTTWITVTERGSMPTEPLSIFSLSIDSVMAAGVSAPTAVAAIDADGADLSFILPITFTISDPLSATVDRSGWVTTIRPERSVMLTATTIVYGTTYTDSVRLNIGYPQSISINVVPRRIVTGETILEFVPDVVYLAAGGVVMFFNSMGDIPNLQTIDVVWSNPEAAHRVEGTFLPTGSGNISPFMWTAESPISAIQVRRFPTEGTLEYHSERYGSRGRIIVR